MKFILYVRLGLVCHLIIFGSFFSQIFIKSQQNELIKTDLALLCHISRETLSDRINLTGCNWYGFGAMFFGCLSMVIHGSISLVRCLPVTSSNFGHGPTIRSTILILAINIVYAGLFAMGEIYRVSQKKRPVTFRGL